MPKPKKDLISLLNTEFGRELGKELAKTLSEAVLATMIKHSPSNPQETKTKREDLKRAARQARKTLHDLKDESPYRILGVTEDADNEVVKAAYKAKSRKAHPDTPTGSNNEMSKINSAYRDICKARGLKP
ncbi:MAG: Chaperone protein DnaJ [Dehalococcoidia bacterium]|nr:Chaperone protein DnaJ [Chloroflexota bacterium]